MPTKIEWTNETWNPVIGCSKISEGCKNCYAEKMAKRIWHMTLHADPRRHMMTHLYYSEVLNDNLEWNGKTTLVETALNKPLSWKKPKMVFVCSMGDLFHESVPFEWILDVWDVMVTAHWHTYQILTKRPERALEFTRWFAKESAPIVGEIFPVLPNIWIGVTCENQEQANKRIPVLLQIPAKKRFISCEPLLGNIDFYEFSDSLPSDINHPWRNEPILYGVNWVIAGPETGPVARPIQKEWIENLYNQCKDVNVPFFDKKDVLGLNIKQFPCLT